MQVFGRSIRQVNIARLIQSQAHGVGHAGRHGGQGALIQRAAHIRNANRAAGHRQIHRAGWVDCHAGYSAESGKQRCLDSAGCNFQQFSAVDHVEVVAFIHGYCGGGGEAGDIV